MTHEVYSGESLPVEVFVTDLGGAPLVGATDITARVRLDADDTYLDFNDGTFKAAGWTERDRVLTEVDATLSPGIYKLAGGLQSLDAWQHHVLTLSFVQASGTGVMPCPVRIVVDGKLCELWALRGMAPDVLQNKKAEIGDPGYMRVPPDGSKQDLTVTKVSNEIVTVDRQ